MNIQLNKFSLKYEHSSFEIILKEYIETSILECNISFFNYNYESNNEARDYILDINFYLINSYDMNDVYDLADSISADAENVVSAFKNYCDTLSGMESVAILNNLKLYVSNLKLYVSIDKTDEKIQIIKYFLAKTIEQFQIIGIGTLLFFSKDIIYDINKIERVGLINELLSLKIIPIYQNSNDVILARNLDYIV